MIGTSIFPISKDPTRTWPDVDVGDDGPAAPALDGDARGLGLDAGGGYDDAGDLDEARDHVGAQFPQGGRAAFRVEHDLHLLHLFFSLGPRRRDLVRNLGGGLFKERHQLGGVLVGLGCDSIALKKPLD